MKTIATITVSILVGSFISAQSALAATVTLTPVTGIGRLHHINRANDAAGYSIGADDVKAFIYSGGSTTRVVIQGAEQTEALGIENNGRVVGWYTTKAVVPTHGFIYFHGDLTTLDYPQATSTWAQDINDPQRVVGYYRDSKDNYHGFFFDKKTYTAIDFPGAVGTYAIGLNNPGDIVGYYTTPDASGELRKHGFLYDKSGKFSTIDVTIPGVTVTDTECRGINAPGVIVGTYIDSDGICHGFIDISGVFLSVDAPGTPGAVGTIVQGINDNGTITASGTTAFLGTIVQ